MDHGGNGSVKLNEGGSKAIEIETKNRSGTPAAPHFLLLFLVAIEDSNNRCNCGLLEHDRTNQTKKGCAS